MHSQCTRCRRPYKGKLKTCLPCRRKDRSFKLNKRYGLSQEDYSERLAAQGNTCPICEEKITGQACVDHCHDTLAVRDILCSSCNVGLGNMRDDHVRLSRAAHYIRHHNRYRGRVSFLKRRRRVKT